MGDGDGYTADPATLNQIKSQLHSASNAFDEVTTKPPAVDAGASSGAVGQTMARVMKLGLALGHQFDTAAGNVDSASGAYDDMENSAKADMNKVHWDTPDPSVLFGDVDGAEHLDGRRKHEGF